MESIVPIAVEDLGNVTVIFVALSYAGTLTVSAIADPDQVPDLTVLMAALQTELNVLAGAGAGHRSAGAAGLSDLSPSAPDRRHRHSLRPSISIRPASSNAASQPASGIS